MTDAAKPAPALEGYRDPKPMVFCGLYPVEGDDFADLREALEKLRLNDSSYTYTPETSGALGFGFRCGFLGLLHMEIIRERLEREFDLALIATAPRWSTRCTASAVRSSIVDNPSEMPNAGEIEHIDEPFLLDHHPHAHRLHRHAHGALPEPAGRDAEARVPAARAGRARSTGCRWPRSWSTSSTR